MFRPSLVLGAVLALAACSAPEPVCEPGTFGCACLAQDACSNGLTCQAGKCAKPVQTGCADGDLACTCASGTCLAVSVGEPSVRSCDLVVTLTARELASVTYATGTRGQHQVRDDRVAVSFVSRADAAFAGAPLALVLEGSASPAGAVKAFEARCFDRTGQPVSTPKVSVQ